MANPLKLAKGWAERLTINILGLFPKVKKETLEKLKDSYNAKNQDIDAAVEDLKSSDPENIGDILNIHGLFKTLKPVILILLVIGAWFIFLKLYYIYKRKR